MINIVVPMAGKGGRLEHLGHKPLINIKGKTMIEWAIESLNLEGNYIFVVQKEYLKSLKPVLKRLVPDCKIIPIDYVTGGATSTVLVAKEFINNDTPLLTVNCDQYLEWCPKEFIRNMKDYDGGVLTYTMSRPDGSFCVLDDEGYVIRVAEKEVISNIGTIGIYYFGKGRDFVKYAEQMIRKDIRVNNEFYILPVYNEMITDGKKIVIHHLRPDQRVWRIGVPDELEKFIHDYRETNTRNS